MVVLNHGADDSDAKVFRQGCRQPTQAECIVFIRQLVDSVENDHHFVLLSSHEHKVHPAVCVCVRVCVCVCVCVCARAYACVTCHELGCVGGIDDLLRRVSIVFGTSRVRSHRFLRNSQRRVSMFLTENDCGDEATI